MKIAGVCNDTDIGTAGLLTIDEVAGARAGGRAGGETVDSGDEVSEADISGVGRWFSKSIVRRGRELRIRIDYSVCSGDEMEDEAAHLQLQNNVW